MTGQIKMERHARRGHMLSPESFALYVRVNIMHGPNHVGAVDVSGRFSGYEEEAFHGDVRMQSIICWASVSA